MSQQAPVDWSKVIQDPRFVELHRRKSRVLWGLMALTVIYYFALPIGAGYYPEIFKIKVWGVVNVGLLFALSQFVYVGIIARVYTHIATQQFDPLAEEICAAYTPKQGS
jgi:uncharacterized membrane protein (DUF485 family)